MNACTHSNLRHVAAKAATCTEDGNTEYYVCKSGKCGKWFTDAEAQYEIFNHDSVKVFAIGHDWSVRDTESENTLVSKATNCGEHDTYWYICATCGELSDTYTFTTVAGAHVDADEDGVCDVCRDGEKPLESEGFLALPFILGGGGGGILIAVSLFIIQKLKNE